MTKYLLTLSLALFLVAACAKHSDGSATQSGISPTALAAFQGSVYKFTRTNCVGCHGFQQAPLFAVSDAEDAYGASKSYANFNDPASSEFVARTMNGHCGSACRTDGSEMEAAIQAWADGELSASALAPQTVAGPTTAAQSVPTTLPTGNTFTTLSWGLDAFGTGFTGASFKIDIQSFGPDAYRFRNPRVVTNNSAITVQHIRIVLNGQFNPLNDNYVSVVATVPAHSNTVVSNVFMLSLIEGGNPDKLSIEFDSITAP